MRHALVVAAHGIPATDYPRRRVGLLMALEFSGKLAERLGVLRRWRGALEREVRAWPRTPENDPYKSAVDGLCRGLSVRLGWPVFAGYNEFCAPTVDEALDQAVAAGADRVVVLPTMLVRGNEHTEKEIRDAVARASARYPTIDLRYAWPFQEERLIELLADQAGAFLDR